MDVVLGVPGVEALMLVDVSIRSAAADRYSKNKAGAAAAAGEQEKTKRYGNAVMPLVFEAGGRLGYESQQTLTSIVSAAAAARLCSAYVVAQWRVRLERAVLFAAADAALRAAGAKTDEFCWNRAVRGAPTSSPW